MRKRTEADLVEAKIVGRRLRWAREALDMSQRQLAAHAGIDPSFVYAMERGDRTPSLFLAQSLIHILGISPQYLLWGVLQGCEIEVQTRLALMHGANLMLPDSVVRADTPRPDRSRKIVQRADRGGLIADQ